MKEQELQELMCDSPVLYHMAERGSWDHIREYGLLCTSALLDLYSIADPQRTQVEQRHRPRSVAISAVGLPGAVIRDQMPMSDAGLLRCLPRRITPQKWYMNLNSKVFFWLTEERLHRLTGAKAYRDREHDVIEVDTRSLIEAHRESIWLCPMNSGCTKPVPHPRDESIFRRIEDYPYKEWRRKRRKGERVVELAVDYAVPDIHEHVRRVIAKKGTETVCVLE